MPRAGASTASANAQPSPTRRRGSNGCAWKAWTIRQGVTTRISRSTIPFRDASPSNFTRRQTNPTPISMNRMPT